MTQIEKEKIELKYKGQDMTFIIDLSTLFTEDRIVPANVPEYPEIVYNEVTEND